MTIHGGTRICLQVTRLLVLVPVFACSSQAVRRHADGQSSRASNLLTVLASPPAQVSQAVWDSLIAPSNVLVSPPSYTGRIVRNALYVRFQREAPASARARAITRVSGEIVGGYRLNPVDGFYIVRIPATVAPGDSSSGPLLRARKLLDSDPSVRATLLLGLDPLVAPTRIVPASAPDSVPGAVWTELQASSNVLHNPPGISGGIIRNALLVAFVGFGQPFEDRVGRFGLLFPDPEDVTHPTGTGRCFPAGLTLHGTRPKDVRSSTLTK